MELEQKVRYLIALGLSEKAARYYLRYETDPWAVVPSFRLLKPLSDDLEFYRGRYRELLVQWQGEGVLEKKDPEAAALLRAGATPEQVERLVYEKTLQAYELLLYQLDDHTGAEVSDAFAQEDFSRCSYGQLLEMGPDRNPTGRYLFEVHGMIPFSQLNSSCE